VFKHNLLTIVQDHHDVFLRQNGFPISTASVAAWHPDFDCDSLPDVDMVDFPIKPFVEKVTTAQGMIQVIRNRIGKAQFTHIIFAYNIEIKRYCNKKIRRHFSSNIFFPEKIENMYLFLDNYDY